MVHKCPKCNRIICVTNHLGESNVRLELKRAGSDSFWICPDCSAEVRVITRELADGTDQYIFDIKQTFLHEGNGNDDARRQQGQPKQKKCPNCDKYCSDTLIRCACGYDFELETVLLKRPGGRVKEVPPKTPRPRRSVKPVLVVTVIVLAAVIAFLPSILTRSVEKQKGALVALLKYKIEQRRAREARKDAAGPQPAAEDKKPSAATKKIETPAPAPPVKKARAESAAPPVKPVAEPKPAPAPAPKPEPRPEPKPAVVSEKAVVAPLEAAPQKAVEKKPPAVEKGPARQEASPFEVMHGEAPEKNMLDGSYEPVKLYLEGLYQGPEGVRVVSCTDVYGSDNGWLVSCSFRKKSADEQTPAESKWFVIRHGRVVSMY